MENRSPRQWRTNTHLPHTDAVEMPRASLAAFGNWLLIQCFPENTYLAESNGGRIEGLPMGETQTDTWQ